VALLGPLVGTATPTPGRDKNIDDAVQHRLRGSLSAGGGLFRSRRCYRLNRLTRRGYSRACADCIGRGLAVIRVTHQTDFVSFTLLPDRCSGTELIVMCSRNLADGPLNNRDLTFCLNVLNNE